MSLLGKNKKNIRHENDIFISPLWTSFSYRTYFVMKTMCSHAAKVSQKLNKPKGFIPQYFTAMPAKRGYRLSPSSCI